MAAEWINRDEGGWIKREYVDLGNPRSRDRTASNGQDTSPSDPEAGLWGSQDRRLAALAGAVLIGLLSAGVGIIVIAESGGLAGGLAAMLAGLAFAGAAVYAGRSTNWLTEISTASLPTKIAAVATVGSVICLALTIMAVPRVLWAVVRVLFQLAAIIPM